MTTIATIVLGFPYNAAWRLMAIFSSSRGPQLQRLIVVAAFVAVGLSRLAAVPNVEPDRAAIDRAFTSFWEAADSDAAARRVSEVVRTGVSFADAFARLQIGRRYSPEVPRGLQRLSHRVPAGSTRPGGLEHPYVIVVPNDYDPARAYPVRVQLHGGVERSLTAQGREGIGRIPGTRDEITVYPNAWNQSVWWNASQVDNLAKILDRLKRAYNVDENRVYLTGISDGGTGAYFMAFRNPTPWASFLPLNGQMLVLAVPDAGADGDIFPGNAVNRPFFIVNGGRDPLYPAGRVRPYIEHLRALGTDIVFHPQALAGHNTDWWPEEREAFERFVNDHPRESLPDRLSWETERTDRYNRVAWLVLDRLGSVGGEADLPDGNLFDRAGQTSPIFSRSGPSGRVDLVRRGNVVEALTTGVRTFTILLSPNKFDFSQPVTVTVNGRVALQKRVEPSVATLLKWAARDHDRTALFGAELRIEVRDR